MGDGYIELPDWLRGGGTPGSPRPAPAPAPASAPAPAPAPKPAHPPEPAPARAPAPPAIVLPDARRIPITGRTLLGRDPVPRPGEPPATLVATGPDRSVSKSHALVEPAGADHVLVTDRRSTNGTAVLSAGGARRALPAETPIEVARGERVALGEVVFHVE